MRNNTPANEKAIGHHLEELIVTLNLKALFNLLHCQINNFLLMQVNNANILKTIGMLYNAILL